MEGQTGSYHMGSKIGLWYSVGIVALSLVWLGAMGAGFWPFSSSAISSAVHQSFSMLCHQLPDRVLIINGNMSLVCARCLGFYGGLLFSWIIIGLAYWQNEEIIKSRFKRFGIFLMVALVIIMINVVGQLLGIWNTPSWLRLLLGAVLGITVIGYIFQSLTSEKFIINLNTSTYGYNG